MPPRHRKVLAALAAPAILISCGGPPAIAPQAPVPAPVVAPLAAEELRDLTEPEKRVLASTLARGLKDPESAKFQWTKFPKAPKEDSVHYCGTVNARNSYGGYVGSKPYIAVVMLNGGKIVGGVIGAVAGYQDEWIIEKMCREKGLDPYRAV